MDVNPSDLPTKKDFERIRAVFDDWTENADFSYDETDKREDFEPMTDEEWEEFTDDSRNNWLDSFDRILAAAEAYRALQTKVAS
jgi:hypothetical protein